MAKKKRRKYSPEEKVAILKKHLLERVHISEICDEYSLHPTVFHRGLKAFFENVACAFEKTRDSASNHLQRKVDDLEKKTPRKNEVLSELMEEHVALKKTVWEL